MFSLFCVLPIRGLKDEFVLTVPTSLVFAPFCLVVFALLEHSIDRRDKLIAIPLFQTVQVCPILPTVFVFW